MPFCGRLHPPGSSLRTIGIISVAIRRRSPLHPESIFLQNLPFMLHPQPDADGQRPPCRQLGANIGDCDGRDMSTGNLLSMQRTADLELLHGKMHESGTISLPYATLTIYATRLTSPTDSMALLYGNHEHCDRHHDYLTSALPNRAHSNLLETQVRVR